MLPYFDGIDWEDVAERKNDPPFDSIKFELNVEESPLTALNVTKEFKDNGDYDELELRFLPKFSSKLDKRWLNAALIQIIQFDFPLAHFQTIPMWLQNIKTDIHEPNGNS